MRRKLFYLFKIAVTAALLWLLFSKVDLSQFFSEIKKIGIGYFLLAVFVSGVSWWTNTLRWQALLVTFNSKIKLFRLFLYNLVGAFYGVVLPGGKVMGDVMRAHQVARDHQGEAAAKNQLILSIFIDRGMGMLGFIIFASFYFIFQHPAVDYLGQSSAFIGTFLLLAAAFGVGLVFSNVFDFLLKFLLRIPIVSIKKIAVFILDSLKIGRANKYQLLCSLTYALATVLLAALSLYVIVWALELNVNYWSTAFFNSLAVILIVVPITVAGIGLREGVLVYLFVQAGIASEKALALSVLNLSVIITIALIGGLVEFYYHFLKRPQITNTPE